MSSYYIVKAADVNQFDTIDQLEKHLRSLKSRVGIAIIKGRMMLPQAEIKEQNYEPVRYDALD